MPSETAVRNLPIFMQSAQPSCERDAQNPLSQDLSQRDINVNYASPPTSAWHATKLPKRQQHRMSIQFLIDADGNPHRGNPLHCELNYSQSAPATDTAPFQPKVIKQQDALHHNSSISHQPQQPVSPPSSDNHVRKYPCLFSGCTSRFLRKHHLESHINTHLSQKGFSCDITGCSSAFSRLHDLQRHKRTVKHAQQLNNK